MTDPIKPTKLETEYWQEISYTCPKRGLVKQRVKIKRFQPQQAPEKPGYELEILKSLEDDDE